MAGFFGLFDYNKVGPGVDKNGPQKRGFVVFFEIYFRKFWKLAQASLLSLLLYFPVLTNGLASAGLAFIGRNYARQKHAFLLEDFKDTIKKNWKQALPVGIINVLLQLIMLYALFFYLPVATEEGGEPSILQYIPFCLMIALNVLFIWAKYYIYMLMITFKFNIRQLYRNSVILALAGIKPNLIISLSLLVLYAVLLMIAFLGEIGLILSVILGMLIVPGFRMLLIQYNIFPLIKQHIIDPYYKEHPNEDMQQRQDLALDPTEEEKDASTEEEEVIFKDMGRTVQEESQKEETSTRKIPKQYTEEQMRRGRRLTRNSSNNDDDDII